MSKRKRQSNSVDGLLLKIDAVVADLARPEKPAKAPKKGAAAAQTAARPRPKPEAPPLPPVPPPDFGPPAFPYEPAPAALPPLPPVLEELPDEPVWQAPAAPPGEEPARRPGYWQVLVRCKKALLKAAFGCMLAGLLVSVLQKRLYQASATVETGVPSAGLVAAEAADRSEPGASASADAYLEAQLQILRSEVLAGRVVSKLGLEGHPEYGNAGGKSPWWSRWFGGKRKLEPRLRARHAALDSLKVRPGAAPRSMEIVFDSTDPRLAASFVNTLAEEYIQESAEAGRLAAQRNARWLGLQLASLKARTEQAEQQLGSLAHTTDPALGSERDSVAAIRLRQIQDELPRATAERVARQLRYETAAAAPAKSLAELLDSLALRDYFMRLADQKADLAGARSGGPEAAARAAELESQIAELETKMANESQAVLSRLLQEYQWSLRREESLLKSFQSQTAILSGDGGEAIRSTTLARELSAYRQLSESLQRRLKEAELASATKRISARVVEAATPPEEPYRPNTLLNAVLGWFGGGGAALIVVLLREREKRAREAADRSIKGPGDAAYLQVPELGVIPARTIELAPESQRRGRRYLPLGQAPGSGAEAEKVALVTSDGDPSPLAESFRTTATSILLAAEGGQHQALVVASPGAGEGRTSAVTNLGAALAEMQAQVLIVDGDLRKPRIHDVFGLSNQWGLSSLMEDETPVEEYEAGKLGLETRIPGLRVLPAGPPPKNLMNLLYSPRLEKLLRRLGKDNQIVLIDSPPMLRLPDARILARLADSVILVLRAGQTTHESALAARQGFLEDGTPLLGLILNHWDPTAFGGRYGR